MANAAEHRESLVHHATRLFRRQGYASTGLAQILADSGAPRGSLYYYFPGGKEALAEAAVAHAGALVERTLMELAARHPRPRAFIRAYCRVMAGWMEESGFRSGCPIATVLLETAPDSPAITQAGQVALDSWVRVIAEVLAQDGSSRRAAQSRAQALVAAIEGSLILARVRQSTRPILDVARLI